MNRYLFLNYKLGLLFQFNLEYLKNFLIYLYQNFNMNILLCSEFFFPSTGGSQKVVEEIARNLIIHGNKVTVATTFIKNRKKIDSIKPKEFKISGNLVNGFSGNTDKYKVL